MEFFLDFVFIVVEILKPAMGSDGIGFSEYVGQFDSLLDTISNERPLNSDPRPSLEIDEEDDAGDADDPLASFSLASSRSVLNLLKSRHNCHM